MQYRYTGPGPVTDPEGEIVRPGDEREFDEEPAWGPWEPVGEPQTELPGGRQQSAAGLAPAQAAADGGQPIVTPLAAPLTAPKGM